MNPNDVMHSSITALFNLIRIHWMPRTKSGSQSLAQRISGIPKINALILTERTALLNNCTDFSNLRETTWWL